jgi:hypothetical protein
METTLKTFKRVSQSKIVLEDIVWETKAEKSIRVRSVETGLLQQSIRVDGIYYYPTAVKGKRAEAFELETISE